MPEFAHIKGAAREVATKQIKRPRPPNTKIKQIGRITFLSIESTWAEISCTYAEIRLSSFLLFAGGTIGEIAWIDEAILRVEEVVECISSVRRGSVHQS